MVAAYSYMALVPIVQPPVIRLLTTQKERRIRMPYEKGNVTQLTKILFPGRRVFSHGEMGSTPYRNFPGVSRSHIHRSHPQYHCGSEPLQLYLLNNTTVFLYSYQRILSDSMVIPCSTTSE